VTVVLPVWMIWVLKIVAVLVALQILAWAFALLIWLLSVIYIVCSSWKWKR